VKGIGGALDVIQTSKLPQGSQPIRVLLAKVGLDGHDRGVRIVARALRDAGMEVVYTGLHRRPEEVVTAAIHEDVDVLGVSILSGAHMTIFPRIIDLLRTQGVVDEILLVGGGVIPDEDVITLKELGVAEILGQETPPGDVVATVRRLVTLSRNRERNNH
jgi:methylmalonyl-CoA mutase C-terminal domain/subunit